jgi:hypothetical protein
MVTVVVVAVLATAAGVEDDLSIQQQSYNIIKIT